jgi:hypothetical protein
VDDVDLSVLATTRRAWHGVAELVLAGPQYRRSGTIRLRVVPGGFATVREPDLRVEGTELVAAERLPLDGRGCADLAAAAGVDVGVPEGLYHDHSGVPPEEPLRVDPAAAAHLAACFAAGDTALRAVAATAGADVTPVLWPEHFDLGITMDEVNYGLSPGDGYLGEPYAYVGPWKARRGEFWNAPFGAARTVRELPTAEALTRFYATGRERAATDPAA